MNTAPEWSRFISWVLINLKLPSARVRFLKALTWALPHRAQQIGSLIFDDLSKESVSERERDLWRELSVAVPEIIPRNQKGWIRYN